MKLKISPMIMEARMTMVIVKKLFAMSSVASSFRGSASKRKIAWLDEERLLFSSANCFGDKEKKATSEPEIRATEKTSSRSSKHCQTGSNWNSRRSPSKMTNTKNCVWTRRGINGGNKRVNKTFFQQRIKKAIHQRTHSRLSSNPDHEPVLELS